MQWAKEKVQKDKQWSTKHYTKKIKIEQHEPTKKRGWTLYWPIWQHISACGPFNISQDLVGLSLIGWLKISRYAECS
jgi:hypothetical protein